MIRRGFWLAVGATGGIIGYRRVAALGRSLSGTLMLAPRTEPERKPAAGPPRPGRRTRPAGQGLARGTIRLARDVRRFNTDVREGVGLYMARHPGPPGPTLGAGTDHHERVKDDR